MQQPIDSRTRYGGGGLHWIDLVMGLLWWKSGENYGGIRCGKMFSSLSASLRFSTLPSFGDPPAAGRWVTPPIPFFCLQRGTTWFIWSRLARGERRGHPPHPRGIHRRVRACTRTGTQAETPACAFSTTRYCMCARNSLRAAHSPYATRRGHTRAKCAPERPG